jgi:phosphoribosylamine--glycine ligase
MAPGSDAMAELGELHALDIFDPKAVAAFARARQIGLCVIGPEGPLAAGVADAVRAEGIPCFGPGRDGAQLEASKDFSKQFMFRYGVATAAAQTHHSYGAALAYASKRGFPVVVKADGLAAGKGVTVAEDEAQLKHALSECFESKAFGEAGLKVLIEDFLQGEEASLLCFSDGKVLAPMASAQDHKRVGEGDTGPNTGGMGAYSPAPVLSDEALRLVRERILEPTLKGLKAEGIDFRGCLYVGLMIGPEGPKVVEFNARFGDPETQVVVPRMDFDLAEVMLACAEGRLDPSVLKWKEEASACVVLASGGYPGSYHKGKAIQGLDKALAAGVQVFHAGTARRGTFHQPLEFETHGGRVLNVCATGPGLKQALERAYAALGKIHFEGMHYRRDIGHRALKGNS